MNNESWENTDDMRQNLHARRKNGTDVCEDKTIVIKKGDHNRLDNLGYLVNDVAYIQGWGNCLHPNTAGNRDDPHLQIFLIV